MTLEELLGSFDLRLLKVKVGMRCIVGFVKYNEQLGVVLAAEPASIHEVGDICTCFKNKDNDYTWEPITSLDFPPVEEAKRCPVCGGEAYPYGGPGFWDGFWRVGCRRDGCKLEGPARDTRDKATNAWNNLSYKGDNV